MTMSCCSLPNTGPQSIQCHCTYDNRVWRFANVAHSMCIRSPSLRHPLQTAHILEHEDATVDGDQSLVAPVLQQAIDGLARHVEMVGELPLRQRDSEPAPGRTRHAKMPVEKDKAF